jgi:putative nucleotidyltransferase with HDIG domain
MVREEIEILFPELREIKDGGLRKKVIELWVLAAERGRWEDLNYDYIVAGGLCHDVGKLLEYERVQKKVKKSRYGELLRHPISGAMLAQEVGLPLEVIHIIAAHSTEGEKLKRTPEAIIIHHCDFIDFDIEKNRM